MTETEKSRTLAEAATVERLLNAYLRETGVFDPRMEGGAGEQALPADVRAEISEQGALMRLVLPQTKKVIWGAVPYVSAFGHHRYGKSFWATDLETEQQPTSAHPLEGSIELAILLLAEIAHLDPAADSRIERITMMTEQVKNSLQKTERYVLRNLTEEATDFWQQNGEQRMGTAEQSLLYGHPFHPTPKSSQGFSDADLPNYAPEMGATFTLHYFAAAPELVKEASIGNGDEGWFPEAVIAKAQELLSDEQQEYRMLPIHPWQAEHLKQWPEVQELLASGQLVDLGALGEPVYPTSSVRTVWDPTHTYFYKLPLNVRITNFIRVNPLEQLERTMGAAQVLSDLARHVPYAGFTILQEAGYRTLAPQHASKEVREKLAESFGVIFRENPVVRPAGDLTPLVIAPLLEEAPSALEPPMIEAIRMAAQQDGVPVDSAFLKKWLTRYLEISLVPVMWLFVKYGVSLEAHVQNSMVALQGGWPVKFYVRDLEGVSISCHRAKQHNLFDGRVDAYSPVLYRDEEAWERLNYYFFVNHLGHLIHTLAYYGGAEETALWQVVGDVLNASGVCVGGGERYLQDLMNKQGLPAKANLISCFQKRGERPSYVMIPNPLKPSGVLV